MKKVITIITIIMFIIAIALIGVLTFRLLSNEDNFNNENSGENIQNIENIVDESQNKVERVDNKDMFFTVKSCVEKFLNYITMGEDETVYNLIEKDYKEEHNITKDNLWNFVKKIKEPQIFTANKMYKLEKYRNNKYYVYGTIRDDLEETDYKETEFNITVVMDSINKTFSIIPEAPSIEEFKDVN